MLAAGFHQIGDGTTRLHGDRQPGRELIPGDLLVHDRDARLRLERLDEIGQGGSARIVGGGQIETRPDDELLTLRQRGSAKSQHDEQRQYEYKLLHGKTFQKTSACIRVERTLIKNNSKKRPRLLSFFLQTGFPRALRVSPGPPKTSREGGRFDRV